VDPFVLMAAAARARRIKTIVVTAVAVVVVAGFAGVAGLSAVLAALPGGGAAALASAAQVAAWTGTSCQAGSVPQASWQHWTAEQVTDAATIISTGQNLGVPAYGIVIAVATAMQESSLRNLPYGDRDSLGLVQQRPSQGWGTPAQLMNPVYAATAFYKALLQVPGWQQLPLTVAAQDVQHSGAPTAYAQWQADATGLIEHLAPSGTELVTQLGTCPGNCPQPAASQPAQSPGSCPAVLQGDGTTTTVPSWYALPAGTPQPVIAAIEYALEQLGKPYLWGGTGPAAFDCSGLVMMAYRAAGITIARTTFAQVTDGTAVASLSGLQPGDLIFTPGSDGSAQNPGHVGMYVGDDMVVAAPQSGTPVQLQNLAGYWEQQAVSIRRIVPAAAGGGSTS
jgi:cell wall-associated NlpC family hydrolase